MLENMCILEEIRQDASCVVGMNWFGSHCARKRHWTRKEVKIFRSIWESNYVLLTNSVFTTLCELIRPMIILV